MLELLKEQLPVLPPYRRFHYSNLGTALLGRALAHGHAMKAAAKRGGRGGTGQKSYEALLVEEVLAPLGMTNATFDTAGAIAADRVAVGTQTDGGAVNLSATCTPAEGAPGSWLAPCGCLWASTDDMARWLKLFFRDGQPADGGQQVRSPPD